jgi:inhibitor of KinA
VSVRLAPAGDLALLVEFEEEVSDEVNARVLALERRIQAEGIPGIVETVPAFRSLLVYYDPLAIRYAALCTAIGAAAHEPVGPSAAPRRRVEIPCCYDDPELGFELETAAARLELAPAQVVELHTRASYPVYFLGFAPGQPYMSGTPQRLQIPRLETPRTRTPVGSVGIGGAQCCVYTVESPGGFWVLGRTPVPLYDPAQADPVLLRPGDLVTFRAISRSEYDRLAADADARTDRPVIT